MVLGLAVNLEGYRAERAGGGEALGATTCPLCTVNLEGYRQQIAQAHGKSYDHLPILAFTQLLALAFGLPRAETGVDMALVPAEPVLTAYL